MDANKSIFEKITETDLRRLATKIATQLNPSDTILLHGQIGAGKSVFARTVIQTLCPHEAEIPSPTFTLIQTYDAEKFTIHHCDLYRLGGPDQCYELGLEDALDADVCLIEWPEKLGTLTPKNALNLSITVDDDTHRSITVDYADPRWATILKDNS